MRHSASSTPWGRVTHICVGKLTIIGSDNGLSPERRQAIIWTNAGILLIGPLGKNLSEILIEIQTLSLKTFENVVCEMLLISSRPPCVKLRIGIIIIMRHYQIACGVSATIWHRHSQLTPHAGAERTNLRALRPTSLFCVAPQQVYVYKSQGWLGVLMDLQRVVAWWQGCTKVSTVWSTTPPPYMLW